jgi:hypothetical protein
VQELIGQFEHGELKFGHLFTPSFLKYTTNFRHSNDTYLFEGVVIREHLTEKATAYFRSNTKTIDGLIIGVAGNKTTYAEMRPENLNVIKRSCTYLNDNIYLESVGF